jgi:hypothetical protein
MRYALLAILLLATGCAKYEYDLIQPVQQHIGQEPPVTLEQPPIRYEMVTDDSQLVVTMHNLTDTTLTLRQEKSYVIDKQGASRAVRGMAIAPKSYIRQTFPPPRPYVRDDGPNVGFGFGAYDGGGMATGVGVGTSTGGGQVQNLDENYYWEWDGEGQVRFHLVFSDDKNTYEHDLVIKRVKK